MPFDPTIALQAKAPTTNPLQMAMQAAQYKYMNSNANALQQQIGANQAMSGIFQNNTDANGNVNYAGVVHDASQNPDAAYNLPQLIQSINTQKIQGVTLQTGQQGLANKRWQALGQSALGFLSNPNATGTDYVNTISGLVKNGVIDAQTGMGELTKVAPDLGDPAKLRSIVQQTLAGLPPEVQAQLLPKLSTVNTGGQTNLVAQNPLNGAPNLVGTLKNTVSPDVAIRPTPTFVGKTPGTIPLGQTPGAAPYVGGAPNTGAGALGSGRLNSPTGSTSATPSNFNPTGPALGVTAAADVAGQDSAKQLGVDRSAVGSSAGRIYQLQTALSGLQNSPTGPGTETTHNIVSFLLAQTPYSLGKYLPGVNVNEIKSYDEANKYLTQYAMAQAGSMGQGTNEKLATALTGNASTRISNLAAQDVVKANIGLERMNQAKINAFDQSGLSSDQYGKWNAQWNQNVDARVFVADQISDKQFGAMVNSMTPKERAAFQSQYNAAVKSGIIQGAQ